MVNIRKLNWFSFWILVVTMIFIEAIWWTLIGGLKIGEKFNTQQPFIFNEYWFFFIPLGLMLPAIISLWTGRVFNAVMLFISVLIVTAFIIILASNQLEAFSIGLTSILTLFTGVEYSTIMYMENLNFIKKKINTLKRISKDNDIRAAIEANLTESKSYFEMTMRGIYYIGSVVAIALSIIWATETDIGTNLKFACSLASTIAIFVNIGGAFIWLAKPLSTSMSTLSDMLIPKRTRT